MTLCSLFCDIAFCFARLICTVGEVTHQFVVLEDFLPLNKTLTHYLLDRLRAGKGGNGRLES